MTAQELAERQAWPLRQKIDHALFTIETFLTRTEGRAYVAFSGGKDSTVLLDLVRIIDPTVPAVFVNTGNEYPDIIRFVRHLRDDRGYNIEEIHPKAKPREVWSRYGFPLVSKAQAQSVHEYQHARDKEKLLARLRDSREKGGVHTIAQKWEWLLFEDFACSHKCCQILKKNPANDYAESTGRAPIIGTLAAESRQRTSRIYPAGVVILSEKTAKRSPRSRFRYGRTRIYGRTYASAGSRLRKSTTKGWTARGVSGAGSAAS